MTAKGGRRELFGAMLVAVRAVRLAHALQRQLVLHFFVFVFAFFRPSLLLSGSTRGRP